MKTWKAELVLLLMTVIWGATFLFTKIGLNDCSPSLYIILRFAIASTISLSLFHKHFKFINKEIFRNGVILGLLFGGGFLLQTFGLKYTSVSNSAFITGLSVVLTPFAFFLVERKPIGKWKKIGVAIAGIGLWIFTNPDFDNINFGDLLTLASCLFWALYITFMDLFTYGRQSREETSLLVILQFLAASSIALLGLFIIDFGSIKLHFTSNLIISLLFNGIVASFFLTLLHTTFQRYSTPVKAALIFALEPVFASIFAMIFLGEVFGYLNYLGAAVLLSGVVVSSVIKDKASIKQEKIEA